MRRDGRGNFEIDFFVGPKGELIKRKSVRSNKHRPWPKPEPESAWAVR